MQMPTSHLLLAPTLSISTSVLHMLPQLHLQQQQH
jgi:hypothetical protein